MTNIHVIGLDGAEKIISSKDGATLMEALRDNGFDEVLALCSGCCSCATCHVYIEAGPSTLLQCMSDDENDLLDSSDHRQPNSRLSCQVSLTDDLDSIRVRLAPAD
ncbi:2Fe-2S iron-sulfur cluster-binding protein [Nitrospirillum iridis]|uniref:2Fe-2S ferredoxin n=1 Tax=Nitrospirillum iridis TaxID=765888 RepID=A0A7X0B6Q0_9PROT|nr:2Fe-2S iron-sulfur cluster-binding protein [Nitrospirillum iridis]MBB6255174.1 2Fe-2S ferredoxin [Nitrospirillum iridis]